MGKFYSNEQTDTSDDFDIDLRLTDGEQNRAAEPQAWVSRGTNCSTCSHTTPHLCC